MAEKLLEKSQLRRSSSLMGAADLEGGALQR